MTNLSGSQLDRLHSLFDELEHAEQIAVQTQFSAFQNWMQRISNLLGLGALLVASRELLMMLWNSFRNLEW